MAEEAGTQNNIKFDTGLVVFAVLILVALAFGMHLLTYSSHILDQFPYFLPIVIGLIAFPALLLTIIYMTSLTHSMGLSSRNQAFGLPPGTVRGVLAIGFMILVLIFGAFTITTAATSGSGQTVEIKSFNDKSIAETARAEARSRYPDYYIVSLDEVIKDEKWEVTISDPTRENEAIDISKQVLTILATALTAIVGFYFGSRTANEPDFTKIIDGAREDWNKLQDLFNQSDNISSQYTTIIPALDKLPTASKDKMNEGSKRLENLEKWRKQLTDAIEANNALKSVIDASTSDPVKLKNSASSASENIKRLNSAWSVLQGVSVVNPGDEAFAKLDTAPPSSVS